MKKIIVAVIVLVVLAGGALLALPYLVNTSELITRVTQKAGTQGRTVVVGSSKLALFPLPHIVLHDVSLTGGTVAAGAEPRIDRAEAYLKLGSLFSGQLELDALVLHKPQFPAELLLTAIRADNASPYAPLLADPAVSGIDSIKIEMGTLQLASSAAPRSLEHYNATLDIGDGKLQLNGTTDYLTRSYGFSLSTTTAAQVERPLNARISQGSDTLGFEGRLMMRTTPSVSGDLSVKLADMRSWTGAAADGEPLPLTLNARLDADAVRATLKDIAFTTTGIVLSGGVDVTMNPTIDFIGSLHFTSLDLDAVRPSFPYSAELPMDINGSLDVTADTITYRGLPIVKANAKLQLLQGELNINQAVAEFPGASKMTFLGLVRRTAKGLTTEGNLEGEGANFKALLPMLGMPTAKLPDEDIRRFRLKANVYLASNQARLSEAQLRLEDAYITGALIAYFEGKTRYEAVVRAANINADHYLQPFRDAKKKPLLGLFDMGKVDMSWLTGLPFDLSINAVVDNFTWNTKPDNKASFKINVSADALVIESINATYNGSDIDGSIRVEPRPGMPFINASLHFTDWGTFAEAETTKHTGWSEAPFDFTNLKSWEGVFDLSFDQFKAANFAFSALKTKASLAQGRLDVSALTARMWQGTLSANGSLETEGVPKATGTYVFQDVESAEVLGTLFGLHDIQGRGSVNGSFVTSGVNLKTWVDEFRGSVGLAGRNIVIEGFDVPMVVRGLQAARAVADIVNVTRLAFNGGQTEFNTLQGDLFFEKGIGKTNGLSLSSALANGVFTGEINLPAWTMNMKSQFVVAVGEKGQQPSLSVEFAGPVDKLTKQFDTSSLEAYVAKKAAADIVR